jgi:cytoskeletal protein RodZ
MTDTTVHEVPAATLETGAIQAPPPPQMPWQAPEEAPKRPYRGRRWLLITLGVVVALLLGMGVAGALTGTGTGTGSKPHVTQSQQAAPSQAPAQTAPSQAPAQTQAPAQPAGPSLSQQVSTWWAGGAQDELAAVQGDMTTISTDAGNYDLAALQADGTQLASDAATALADPAPGRMHGPWAKAMTDYQLAGQFLSNGMISEATLYTARGTHQIDRATAIVKSLTG